MAQNPNILQELRELESTLATANLQPIFEVPQGYFEGLADQVLNRIRAMEADKASDELAHLSPLVNEISRQMPYSVPSGYFEGFEVRMMQNLLESSSYLPKESFGQLPKEELDTLSPLLAGLSKEMPYTVPQGYFEEIQSGLNDKFDIKPAAKIISITTVKWFKYAAAAVVTGVIILAGFLYINPIGNDRKAEKQIAKLTRDIKKMNEIQKDNLIEFMDAGLTGKETVQTITDKSNEVKELLLGISDEELKDFTEQSEDIEEVLMTN